MLDNIPWLSILIWIPIFSGLLLLFARDLNSNIMKGFSCLVSFFTCIISFYLAVNFDAGTWHMQWQEHVEWIPDFGIYYSLGVDGIALPLVVLSNFCCFLAIYANWHTNYKSMNIYLASYLIMQGLLVGIFAAQDAILFYVFWEAVLIPMFIIIGVWGGENRRYATIKFFLYTFLGSVFLLIALIYLHLESINSSRALVDSFKISSFQNLKLGFVTQQWLFIAMFVAFAVKIPMWPVHTWLPDAHVQAPTEGSVILAAVLLKFGGYGLIRFVIPICPAASAYFSDPVIIISLIAVVYIGFMAIIQADMKKLIAYSSISHMGFVTLGLFAIFSSYVNQSDLSIASQGVHGAMVQMLSHGLISAGLFFCVGILYRRGHSKQIDDYAGVANVMPRFAMLFMVFAMANVGLPGTSAFVGEFLVILAAFKVNVWYAVLAATTLILGASYTLWMYKRVMFGSTLNAKIAEFKDIQNSEYLILIFLALAVIWFGVRPYELINMMDKSIEHVVEHAVHGSVIGYKG